MKTQEEEIREVFDELGIPEEERIAYDSPERHATHLTYYPIIKPHIIIATDSTEMESVKHA